MVLKNKTIPERSFRKLRISGVEPLNYIDIAKVIKHAKRIGFEYISIMTNGIRLENKRLVASLIDAGVDAFDIPVYGLKNIEAFSR